MELIDLIPNAMSFRVITTIDIEDEAEIPVDFTGASVATPAGR